jgi:hypothetical protein
MPLVLAVLLFFSTVGATAANDAGAPPGTASAPQAAPAQPAPAQPAPAQPAPALAPPAQPPAVAAVPAQPPPPSSKPGFLHEVGRWWDESVANFNAQMKDSQSKMDDFNARAGQAAKDAAKASQEAMKKAADAAKEAATAVVRMPNTRVIEVREKCQAASNGAPDCRTAADTACRGKGFNTGQPADISTAQKCPATVWLSGRTPAEGECALETVVTRAVCQ